TTIRSTRCSGCGKRPAETGRAPGSPAPAGAVEEKAYLVVVVALRNTRGKPGVRSTCTADEEHGAGADGRWRRRKDVVDSEITVGCERDTCSAGAVLYKGCGGFANQRGEDTLIRVPPDIVPARQQ